MTSLFQKSPSLSSISTFQQLQRIGFTYHNSYVIPGLVPDTVLFFWKELITVVKAKQSYGAPRLKYSTVVITNGNGCFTFYVDFFFPRLFLDLTIWLAQRMSSYNFLPYASMRIHHRFFGGSKLVIVFLFSVLCLFVFILCLVPNVTCVSGLSILDC